MYKARERNMYNIYISTNMHLHWYDPHDVRYGSISCM